MTIEQVGEEILKSLGKKISLATPLGLGKPNFLLNWLYRRAVADPSLALHIHTALDLNPPHPPQDLARRFFGPFAERQWGADYPELEYARDAEASKLPPNVRVHEFYFRAGAALRSPSLQRDYQSINYTHVAESVFNAGVNLIVQMVARDPATGRLSLSCNPDVTLDLNDLYSASGRRVLKVGVVHPDLPYLSGDAEVDASFFDFVCDSPPHKLFGLPRLPMSSADHAIGHYAAQWIRDGGTLQIGIGSLSDAVVAALLMRHQDNARFLRVTDHLWAGRPRPSLESGVFEHGLYGLSEMVTDGYMHMRRAGILRREVIDEKSGTRTYLHGAFYLGSSEFYAWLRSLRDEDYRGLRMTRVSRVNDLYDPNEVALRVQRKHPRFLNTCMQVSLLGGVASETLDNGAVVSGVGGQYNFVAMAAELRDSRSLLMLRSTRESGGKRTSNIVWSSGHLTIPRHLRDVVITEYGVADLRHQTDEVCIQRMIEISDSAFQEKLRTRAVQAGKLHPDWRPKCRDNTPARVAAFAHEADTRPFALGSDFTPVEQNLVRALELLQGLTKFGAVGAIFRGLRLRGFDEELARMRIGSGFGERINAALLRYALKLVTHSV